MDSWLLIPIGFVMCDLVQVAVFSFVLIYRASVHCMNAAGARVEAYLALQAAVTDKPHAPAGLKP